MTATTHAVIGGQPRHLGAWKRSPRKLQGIRPTIDVAALPMACTIAGFPTSYDQGQLGSCGPNSVAEVLEHQLGDQRSRLFLYWFTRATEGDILDDGGVVISDLVHVAQTMGVPLETLWPYDVALFQAAPPIASILDAAQRRVHRADIVVDLDHMLYEIARGQAVTFGFGVPASMQEPECALTGVVPVPSASDPVIGGHCVNAIGFDRTRGMVQATCHYGEDFGDRGCIWLPFAHFTGGNASDMTAIRAPGFTG